MVGAAEALVTTLVDRGAEVLFLNPGTDTAPVQEAVLALRSRGRGAPRVVLCLHEVVALAAAHGFYAVTGRAQAVMVHVDVGTQNLGSMVHNAARAEVGVVILAGRTPYTAEGELPGGRDSTVHWWQDVPDQAAIVRQYVKHADDLAHPETLVRQVHRAFQVAGSTPAGPVYLTAARETLMAEAGPMTPSVRLASAPPPAPNQVELRRVVEALDGAARPVIVTSRVGRDPAALEPMVAIAERLGAPVVETRERVNFPSTHPLYLGNIADSRAALAAADAVLVVDAPVPWVPANAAPPDDAFVAVMEPDPIHPTMPAWSYPADARLQCDPVAGLRDLLAGLGARTAPAPAPWWRTTAPAAGPAAGDPLTAGEVAAALGDLLDPEDIVVEEATTNAEAIRARLPRTLAGTYFRSGGSGLGWALGACLGIGLAAPERRVACLVGDGAFLFGEPAAALWAMREHDVPSLVVVLRNGGYAASRRPVLDLFPGGESARTGEILGTLFTDLDLAGIAVAAGAFGDHVRVRSELVPALSKAWQVVTDGQPAVVVVEVSSPWI